MSACIRSGRNCPSETTLLREAWFAEIAVRSLACAVSSIQRGRWTPPVLPEAVHFQASSECVTSER